MGHSPARAVRRPYPPVPYQPVAWRCGPGWGSCAETWAMAGPSNLAWRCGLRPDGIEGDQVGDSDNSDKADWQAAWRSLWPAPQSALRAGHRITLRITPCKA